MRSLASYSKGQMKIQQMAFVLVAIMIFFGLSALFFFSIRIKSLQQDAESLREAEVKALVQKMSSSPELSWELTDCASCIDLDKALILKDRQSYSGFWKLPLLQIEKIYPKENSTAIECTKANYPDCQTITIVKENKDYIAHDAFVALCRHEQLPDAHEKCELGKLIIGFAPA